MIPPPFPRIYYLIISENWKAISHYVRHIEFLTTLPIFSKLEKEVQLISENKNRIRQDFDIHDPNKYRMREDATEYHPLGLLFYQVQEQLKPFYNKQLCPITTKMHSLSNIGETLSVLVNAGVVGVNVKIDKLVSKEKGEYEKSLYELTVAAQYVSHGHEVRFIETSSEKTADILVDNNVEIECKKKDLIHPYYQKYQDLWKIIESKVPEWMDRVQLNYMIYVIIKKEINIESIKKIKTKIHDLIYRKEEGVFELDDSNISIKAKILLPYDLEIDIPLTDKNFPEIMKAIPNIGDVDMMSPLLNIQLRNDKIIEKNFRLIAMKIPQHPLRTIVGNIKNAAKQVSSSLPSIVYVDISAFNQKMKIFDLEQLGIQVNNLLRNNHGINAVVITDTYTAGPEGRVEIRNGIWVLPNSSGKHNLPTTFSIPFEMKSSKESLIANNYWVE